MADRWWVATAATSSLIGISSFVTVGRGRIFETCSATACSLALTNDLVDFVFRHFWNGFVNGLILYLLLPSVILHDEFAVHFDIPQLFVDVAQLLVQLAGGGQAAVVGGGCAGAVEHDVLALPAVLRAGGARRLPDFLLDAAIGRFL